MMEPYASSFYIVQRENIYFTAKRRILSISIEYNILGDGYDEC